MWSILLITVLCLSVGADDRLAQKYFNIIKELISTEIDAIDPESYHWLSEDVTESPSPSPHDEETTMESSKASMTSTKDLPKTADGYSTMEQYFDEWSRNLYVSEIDLTRGIPGVDYPNYTDIPQTSFTCSDKTYIPGFYADMDADCQVFHVCSPHRRESFLCPVGTTFSQPLLACDYWYKSNCSLAPYYYDSNAGSRLDGYNKVSNIVAMVDFILGKGHLEPLAQSETKEDNLKVHEDMSYILKFLPVKAKVVVYPEDSESRSKTSAQASVGKNMGSKTRQSREQEETNPDFEHSEAPIDTQTWSQKSRVKRSLGGGYVNPSIGLAVNIFNKAMDLVWIILRDIEKLRAIKGKMMQGLINERDLSKLKQSFMSKPAGISKYTTRKLVLPTKTKGTTEVKPDGTDFSKKFSKRQIFFPTQPMQTVSASSSTEERLIENYIKLYKTKKA